MTSGRCSVRGCVFPTPAIENSYCLHHERFYAEGQLFQSHQPSHLLALYAPMGLPDKEPDDSRHTDRKRWVIERETFIMDEPETME